ncbi:MAG: SDR family NAD(P)-dependent oxidoreductase [Myxococcales bacterium]|nr:SDR family NAD(P)-dependent oxidoreductase [Myxococcales bacterium]
MSLDGRWVLITGANGGLGLATSIRVLKEGGAVVLACRTAAKADATRDLVVAAAGVNSDRVVAVGGFDMLDPAGIEAATAALPPVSIDVVFLQAGGWVWADEVQTVALNGATVEQTVAKNVVGAHATLRALMAAGRLSPGARVVIIGGEGARGVPGAIRKPAFSDVRDFERHLAGVRGDTPYVPIDALGVAKLCAALWAQHLAKRVQGSLEVVWFSPGLIGGTGGTAGMPAWKELLFQRVAFPILVALGKAQWPESAAEKCVDCLAGRVGRHGDLLGAPEGTALGPLTDQRPMNRRFTDEDFQRVLWRRCEAAAGSMPLETMDRDIA